MEHSDLGAGFQIAMSDLKIRGGGTILGASQSGHIAAVGYDMFLQLMEEAIAELKGEEIQEALWSRRSTTTMLPRSCPTFTYIPDHRPAPRSDHRRPRQLRVDAGPCAQGKAFAFRAAWAVGAGQKHLASDGSPC
jgi:hypothetical protein